MVEDHGSGEKSGARQERKPRSGESPRADGKHAAVKVRGDHPLWECSGHTGVRVPGYSQRHGNGRAARFHVGTVRAWERSPSHLVCQGRHPRSRGCPKDGASKGFPPLPVVSGLRGLCAAGTAHTSTAGPWEYPGSTRYATAVYEPGRDRTLDRGPRARTTAARARRWEGYLSARGHCGRDTTRQTPMTAASVVQSRC